MLGELKRLAEAQGSAEAAVTRYRELAKTNTARYRPELARSLDNLVVLRVCAGRYTQALEPAAAAVALHRDMAELEPSRCEPELATALTNHGVCLSKLGQHAEALPIAEDAVRRYRRLHAAELEANREPNRYRDRLAHALENLAVDLDAMRRHPEADNCRREASELYPEHAGPVAQNGPHSAAQPDSEGHPHSAGQGAAATSAARSSASP